MSVVTASLLFPESLVLTLAFKGETALHIAAMALGCKRLAA